MEPPWRDKGDRDVAPERAREHTPSERVTLPETPVISPVLDRDIPVRLKALRTSLGLSAATMDRQAGFSTGTTGRLERGDLRVYANHLYRICHATGIAIGYFYDQHEAPEAPANDGQELEKQRLLRAYMKIQDPTLKRDVFELVETLAAASTAKRR